MYGWVGKVSLLWTACLWAILLVCPTDALEAEEKLAMYSHVHEKLWLWDKYQISCLLEGPENQKDILPWNTQRGAPLGLNNKGYGGGALNYSEFMQRARGLSVEDTKTFKHLTKEPTTVADLMDAAEELFSKGYGGILPDVIIDPTVGGKHFSTPEIKQGKNVKPKPNPYYMAKDPYRTGYTVIIDMQRRKMEKLRMDIKGKPELEEKFNTYLDRMKQNAEYINILREEELNAYKPKFFMTPPKVTSNGEKIGGLGIPEDKVKFYSDERQSVYKETITYKEMDVKSTWESLDRAFRKNTLGLTNFGDFKKFANELGNPKSPSADQYKDANRSHFRVHKSWKKMKKSHTDEVEVLEKKWAKRC